METKFREFTIGDKCFQDWSNISSVVRHTTLDQCFAFETCCFGRGIHVTSHTPFAHHSFARDGRPAISHHSCCGSSLREGTVGEKGNGCESVEGCCSYSKQLAQSFYGERGPGVPVKRVIMNFKPSVTVQLLQGIDTLPLVLGS